MEEKVKSDKMIISSEKNIIVDRISDLVRENFHGVFAKTVEERYMEKWQERLPPNWTDIVSSSEALQVETTINNVIIVPIIPKEQPCTPVQLTWEMLDIGKDLGVYITHATSTSNVWFRIIGEEFSEKYEDMMTKMDVHYKGPGAQDLALTVEQGQYFAVCLLKTWIRVRVDEVNDAAKTVTVCLVDHGDTDSVPFQSLYRLAPQFCQLPCQALQCCLDGLDEFGDDTVASEIVKDSDFLIGQTLIARVISTDALLPKVIFYDTSSDDDVVVNDQIRDYIVSSKSSPPELPKEGCAMEVVISHVSQRGEVFIQIPGVAYNYITDILAVLTDEEISTHKLTSFRQIVLKKVMYLAKYSVDDLWYRAVVTAPPSVQQNKIAVQFVDFGNAETVTISDIADMKRLPPLLSNLPPQAVKVALHKLSVENLSIAEVDELKCLLLDEENVVLIKTVSLKEDPPLVEIFTKSDTDNAALVSVNIKMENLRKNNCTEENKNSLKTPVPKTNSNSFFNIPNDLALKIPQFTIDEFSPVLIMLTANPDNFFFQSTKYKNDLKTLQGQMQDYYNSTALPEVPTDQILKGKLFAALYSDNVWYRAVVRDSATGGNVPVKLCDFGDILCMSPSSLRELEPSFLKYPFMAIKGKLFGVVPRHRDWSVEDCLRFRALVEKKVLGAFIVDVQENVADPLEMVVTLDLVDTSTEEDKVISEILIMENRAVKAV